MRNRLTKALVVFVLLILGGSIFTDRLVPKAYAGTIEMRASATSNSGSQPIAKLKNNGNDVSYLPPPSGHIGAYFKRGETKLVEKLIDANSTNSEGMYAEKNGGTSSSGDEWWKFTILDSNDFDWKNIIAHRYGQSGVNDSNAIPEDTVDVWYEDGNWVQSGSFSGITSGVYDRWKFEQYNHADLDRNRKVNFEDYAIFANNFGRTDPNCGADPNNLDDYSDINRNGVIDYNDLSLFSDNWLWDANDSNTW